MKVSNWAPTFVRLIGLGWVMIYVFSYFMPPSAFFSDEPDLIGQVSVPVMVLKRQWHVILTGLCWLVPARFVVRGYRFYLAMGALISVLIIQIYLLLPFVVANLVIVKEAIGYDVLIALMAIAVSVSTGAVIGGVTILPAVLALLIVFNERAADQPINEPDGPAAEA